MKRILIIAFCFFAVPALAQTQVQSCTQPVTAVQFETIRNQVQQQVTSAMALQKARELARQYCYSSTQARDLLQVFVQDNHKAEIGRLLYSQVTDRANFPQVYDIFSNASALASLARHVQEMNTMQQSSAEQCRISREQVVMPLFSAYTGRRFTNQQPLDESSFVQFKNSVLHQNIYIQLQKVLDNNRNRFLSMAQVIDLALLFAEDHQRLEVLQHYVRQTVDLDHYPYALQLLCSAGNKNEYVQYVQFYMGNANQNNTNNPGNPSGAVINCQYPVSANDLALIKGTLERSRISSVRIKQYKAAIKGKCLSVEQIRTLVLLFSNFDRLDLLKYSYDYCTDLQHYYSLSDVLSSSLDAERFAEFLQGK